MSASELFDLVRPVVVVASALFSTWILFSSRRRFPFYQALLWAITTYLFPLIIVPLYWVVLLWKHPQVYSHVKHRFIIPLTYLVTILGIAAGYKYFDDRTVDAYLARAANAKVKTDPISAIREYREALKIEDTAHTRKLLAVTLEEAGLYAEAITEYRAAESGGEPDDSIHYRLGVLLERSNQKEQSIIEFESFVSSGTCLHVDDRCEDARHRVVQAHQ
jgi:Uncharacterized protein conserved in bacteria containing a divergent form of TPR repeats